MKYTVNLHNEIDDTKIGEGLSEIGEQTLKIIEAQTGSLSIALVDETVIQDLNLRYRGVDNPTDVLAFGDGQVDLETGEIYFGDVVISIPTARDQAESAGHSLESELALLTVHGILHLLGHDHQVSEQATAMDNMQADILHRMGFDSVHSDPAQ